MTIDNFANFGTLAVHAGAEHDPVTGAVIEPISLSTTYAQTSAAKPVGVYEYSRSANPNRDNFEACVAALERAKYALGYASGSAATANVLQALAPQLHVVAFADVYGGTHRCLTKASQGLQVDFTNNIEEELEGLIKPDTRLVWIESPSNPTLTVTDISKVASIVTKVRQGRSEPLYLVVDNTFMSPYVQNPLVQGADIVLHSVTKYINGHSDVVMGVVATSDDKINETLRFYQNALGAVPSAFDSWLAHRGLKTLHLRSKAACSSSQAIAEALEARIGKGVKAVSYPGLKSHPRREVVQRQHRDGLGGGMVSFRIEGGAEGADKFCQNTKLFTLAESLGGIESLCEVPAAMTHAGIPKEAREASGVYDDLIRLSIGIEDQDDLVNDILTALDAVVN